MNLKVDRVSVFPVTDVDFMHSVETAVAAAGAQQIDDPRVLGAVRALLQVSYPTVTLQIRRNSPGNEGLLEVFRDPGVLDRELVSRARVGDQSAMSQLYDRHQRLVYAVAVQATSEPTVVADAVVRAFRTVLSDQPEVPPVGIRLAVAAREAALSASGAAAGGSSRPARQRAVIELAHGHRLTGGEIAHVLRTDVAEVCSLANDGLRTLKPLGEAPSI